MPSDSQYLWSTAHSMIAKPPTIADDLVGLDQLVGEARDLGRVGLLGVDLVRDRVAVDAAVVVDAVEVRLGHVGAVREVGARLLGDDRADLDRRSGGLRARLLSRTWSRRRPPSRWSSYRRRRCSTCCSLSSLPHAATSTDRPATSASSASACRHLRSQPKIVLTCDPPPPPTTVLSPRFAKRTAVRKTNLLAGLARSQGASAACLGEFAQASRGHRVHLRHTP